METNERDATRALMGRARRPSPPSLERSPDNEDDRPT
jgi:hypothetical protein